MGFINDPIQLLRGRVEGLEIVQTGNDPQGNFAIRMRGINTLFYGSTNTGLALDGVPVTALNLIDPSDVDAVSFYRDGAPFGIRGINGVAAFASKTAASHLGLSYNSMLVVEKIGKELPFLTAAEFVKQGGTDLGNVNDWRRLVSRSALSHWHNLAYSNSCTWGSRGNLRITEGELVGSLYALFSLVRLRMAV
jgi:TonB-dependent starch-binding outer membrane protein SusC